MADLAVRTSAVDALVKIARAQQRGTLPISLSVRYDAPLLGVTLDLNANRMLDVKQRLATYGDVLDWLRRNFPEGRDRPSTRSSSRWNRRYQSPRSVWVDWHEYQTASGLVRFSYPTTHVCREFRADTRDHNGHGLPKWICVSCPKPLTITEARRRGLLPFR